MAEMFEERLPVAERIHSEHLDQYISDGDLRNHLESDDWDIEGDDWTIFTARGKEEGKLRVSFKPGTVEVVSVNFTPWGGPRLCGDIEDDGEEEGTA